MKSFSRKAGVIIAAALIIALLNGCNDSQTETETESPAPLTQTETKTETEPETEA